MGAKQSQIEQGFDRVELSATRGGGWAFKDDLCRDGLGVDLSPPGGEVLLLNFFHF